MRCGHVVVALTVAELLATLPSAGAQRLDSQLKPLVDQLVVGCSKAGLHRLTVIDFVDLDGNATALGRLLAEELEISLLQSQSGFALVEREHLALILKERKLTAAGLVRRDVAKEIGRLAGVDGIVIGTVTPMADSVGITVKVFSVETAMIVAAARADVARTRSIDDVDRLGATRQGEQAGPDAAATPVSPTPPALPKATKITAGLLRAPAFNTEGDFRIGDEFTLDVLDPIQVQGVIVASHGAKLTCRVAEVSSHHLGIEGVRLEGDKGTFPIATEVLKLQRPMWYGVPRFVLRVR
jgi:hypothetical protein